MCVGSSPIFRTIFLFYAFKKRCLPVNKWAEYKIGPFTLGRICSGILALAVCLVAYRLILKITDRVAGKFQIDKNLRRVIRTVVQVALLFLTVLITADCIGVPITSLVAVLSVVGVALSLAVQDSLTKLIGGMVVLITKPFSTGDMVEVDGVCGTIKRIGLVYTCVCTLDNRLVYLPNNDIANDKIVNFSALPIRRVDVDVCVSYECDTQLVKDALEQAVKLQPGTLDDPEPFFGISAYLDSSVRYTVRVWAKSADYYDIYYGLLETIRISFKNNGVEMTYPQVNVHLDGNVGAKGGTKV